jgi:hypothetical protein
MLKSHIAGILVAFSLTATSLANARNLQGGYMVKGYGAKSCGSFVTAYVNERQDNITFLSWLQGFISGYNYFNQDGVSDVAPTDINGLEQWSLNYCRAQPTQDISAAAISFVKAHKSSARR